jgi:hypothetical protein
MVKDEHRLSGSGFNVQSCKTLKQLISKESGTDLLRVLVVDSLQFMKTNKFKLRSGATSLFDLPAMP